mgnify:CR=1 FL=1
MSAPPSFARVLALNPTPHKYANMAEHDLVAKLAGVKALRCGRRNLGALTTYISSSDDLARWRYFHTAVVDGNFFPLSRWLEKDASLWPVTFGLVLAQPLAEWLRSMPHYSFIRQIEAGLAALYHFDSDEKKHIMRCQLFGPMLDRVLEVHERYFVAGGLDLKNEFKNPPQLRHEFDEFVRAHSGAAVPAAFPLFFQLDSLFLGSAEDPIDEDAFSAELVRWCFERDDFGFGYWHAYIRCDDWEQIVEKNDYD